MIIRKIIGGLILLTIFVSLFVITVMVVGWIMSAVIWITSIILTALIVGGLYLLFGDK